MQHILNILNLNLDKKKKIRNEKEFAASKNQLEEARKKLGVLVVKNLKDKTTGIITDGQIRRASQKNKDLQSLIVKKVMTSTIIFSLEKIGTKILSSNYILRFHEIYI